MRTYRVKVNPDDIPAIRMMTLTFSTGRHEQSRRDYGRYTTTNRGSG